MSTPTVYTYEKGKMFRGQSMKDCIHQMRETPTPQRLYSHLWYEGEIACLFADTNVGKSIYAVQIGMDVAEKHPDDTVLYFDFEMSAKQFQMRYNGDGGIKDEILYPNNFFRLEVDPNGFIARTPDEIMTQIEDEIVERQSRFIIIDNITWLCNSCESGDAAGELMQELVRLKREYSLSILVLAHTPKRNQRSPLTQNSLAGSKRIANFLDSMFAIGIDHTNLPDGRYVKQIKSRSSAIIYGEDSVMTYQIQNYRGCMYLVPADFAQESKLLEGESPEKQFSIDADPRFIRAQEMINEGCTIRMIAEELQMSPKTICKIRRSMNS